jgi:hypothetical protein
MSRYFTKNIGDNHRFTRVMLRKSVEDIPLEFGYFVFSHFLPLAKYAKYAKVFYLPC